MKAERDLVFEVRQALAVHAEDIGPSETVKALDISNSTRDGQVYIILIIDLQPSHIIQKICY